MFFGQTISAAFVTAAGLAFSAAATPLPYTLETNCSIVFFDGSRSTTCDGYWTEVTAGLSGADGTNELYATAASFAAAYLHPDETGSYENAWGVTGSSVTNHLSFAGITPGPVRAGSVDIFIDAQRLGMREGGMTSPPVSYAGFPEFVCRPLGGMGLCAATVPFILGRPFSFEIETDAFMSCPWECSGDGEVAAVQLHIWDAAGNAVPIYASSAVPEPGHLGSAALALTAAAYVVRHQLKRRG